MKMNAVIFLIYAVLLCVPSVILDLRERRIPVIYVAVLSGVCCILNLIFGFLSWQEILVGVLVGALFLFISFLTKEAIGYGDSILILGLGLALGGVTASFAVLCALLSAGLIGLIYVKIKRKGRRYQLPFAPFLAVASVCTCVSEWIGVML